MKIAIITLTKGAAVLGEELLNKLDNAVLYVHSKFHTNENRSKKIDKKLKDFVKDIFNEYECLVFIMATGIVVRSIAPYLEDKRKDPAVVVLDEKGKNVISLLSGHIGRANEYTIKIANVLNANPVITTASDVNNSIAVDTLAMKLNCEIEDFNMATKVTAHIVNGEEVGILSNISVNMSLPNNVKIVNERYETINKLEGLIYITEKENVKKLVENQVLIRPKNIIIGIGCKKGKSYEEIINAIKDLFDELNLSIKSIKHIATVDIKKDEKGIIDVSKELKRPLVIVDREDIKKVENRFETSPFVKKTIGVGAVCEPVAFLSSKNGKMIQGKKSYNGITIALFREGE
ncbi:cobalt-precorrin 5A hydrolase [Lutibacter sp. B2]|nr:cobalt-precorrin 5A hydrolase [Lutibacter sp. B2]